MRFTAAHHSKFAKPASKLSAAAKEPLLFCSFGGGPLIRAVSGMKCLLICEYNVSISFLSPAVNRNCTVINFVIFP